MKIKDPRTHDETEVLWIKKSPSGRVYTFGIGDGIVGAVRKDEKFYIFKSLIPFGDAETLEEILVDLYNSTEHLDIAWNELSIPVPNDI